MWCSWDTMPLSLIRNKIFISPADANAVSIKHTSAHRLTLITDYLHDVSRLPQLKIITKSHEPISNSSLFGDCSMNGQKYPAFSFHFRTSLLGHPIFSTPCRDGWAIPLKLHCSLTSSPDWFIFLLSISMAIGPRRTP